MSQYRSDSPQVERNELPHKLSKDITLTILGSSEILEKSEILLEKLNFGNKSLKVRKIRYHSFPALSNFLEFLYFIPN